MQNKVGIIGLPTDVPEVNEAAPLCAAILAEIGTGFNRDDPFSV